LDHFIQEKLQLHVAVDIDDDDDRDDYTDEDNAVNIDDDAVEDKDNVDVDVDVDFFPHLFAGNLMIWLQTQSQIGSENGINLWHYTGNAGNSWQTFSVDIGALHSPFVVSVYCIFR
jgi:hypothetical protein